MERVSGKHSKCHIWQIRKMEAREGSYFLKNSEACITDSINHVS